MFVEEWPKTVKRTPQQQASGKQRAKDSDSEADEGVRAPSYRESLGDAIQTALETYKHTNGTIRTVVTHTLCISTRHWLILYSQTLKVELLVASSTCVVSYINRIVEVNVTSRKAWTECAIEQLLICTVLISVFGVVQIMEMRTVERRPRKANRRRRCSSPRR